MTYSEELRIYAEEIDSNSTDILRRYRDGVNSRMVKMTEESNNEVQSQDNLQKTVEKTTSSDVSSNKNVAETNTSSEGEKTVKDRVFTQDEVNKMVGLARSEGAARASRETIANLQADIANSRRYSENTQTNNENVNLNNMSQEQLRHMIADEAARLAQDALAKKDADEANRTVNEFVNKISAAKGRYPDIEEAAIQLNLLNAPLVVSLANSLDNTADIIYELSKNPRRYAELVTLSNVAPTKALSYMKEFSDSIKKNSGAGDNQKLAPEPIDQISHSNAGTDNGSMSVRDLKNQKWCKG